jgi:hypothetical protein
MTAHPHVDVQPALRRSSGRFRDLIANLNGPRHRKAVMLLMVVVLAHWAEHIFQAVQVFALGWPRPEARGALGTAWPWLVSSEWLHYMYAIAMLIGLLLLRGGFTGSARSWWDAALYLQIWHHIEHLLLLGQALAHQSLFGAAKPTSIAQLIIPRVELHLFYNAIVFTPMVIAVYLQFSPQPRVAQRAGSEQRVAQPPA